MLRVFMFQVTRSRCVLEPVFVGSVKIKAATAPRLLGPFLRTATTYTNLRTRARHIFI